MNFKISSHQFKHLLVPKKKSAQESWGDYYKNNEHVISIYVFIFGFLFDVLTLSDIDDNLSLAQQIIYLLFLGAGIYCEILFINSVWQPSARVLRVWKYKELALHFILGSLLSVYSLYYFKSASISSSFLFMIFVAALLIGNEFPQIQNRGPIVRLSIWALCLSSFFLIVSSVSLGSVGAIPFAIGYFFAASMLALYLHSLHKRIKDFKKIRLLIGGSVGTLALFMILYLFKITPPVPVALKFIGIYHKIEKKQGDYIRTDERPWWRFWHNGDQYFISRPGDKIYVYLSIYSPATFSDQVQIRWLHKDLDRGWQFSDMIPLKVSGGRAEGFRGFAYKSNYLPGAWRVQVETQDGREIGRIYFDVVKETAAAIQIEK